MSVEEVTVFARMCKEDGDPPERILETVSCIDDCLSILQSAAMINNSRGNKRNRKTTLDALQGRIMAAKI